MRVGPILVALIGVVIVSVSSSAYGVTHSPWCVLGCVLGGAACTSAAGWRGAP
jgi:hypothetical protein